MCTGIIFTQLLLCRRTRLTQAAAQIEPRTSGTQRAHFTSYLLLLITQVVKVIWHKTASPPQTDGSILFARWRPCAFPCGHTWRHLANTIELVLPLINLSSQSKRQIDPFSRSATGTAHDRKSIYLQWAALPPKLPLAMGMWTPNTRFLGPTRVLNPNGISISSGIFAGLTSVTDRQTDRPRYSVGNNRLHLHRVSKNVPPSTCYNLYIHDPITTIFGRCVTEKVRKQTVLCFPTSVTSRI